MRMILWPYIILYYIVLIVDAGYNINTAGPYDIIFRHAEQCPDVGTGEIVQYIKIKKLNRQTSAIDGNISLKIPLDDDITVNALSTLKLAQFTNGGYKQNFYTQEVTKSCSSIGRLLPVLQKELFKLAKMGKCPVKPGNYYIYNFTTKEDINIVPVFFYNKYRAEIIYSRFGKRVGCLQIFAEIVPKRQHRRKT